MLEKRPSSVCELASSVDENCGRLEAPLLLPFLFVFFYREATMAALTLERTMCLIGALAVTVAGTLW